MGKMLDRKLKKDESLRSKPKATRRVKRGEGPRPVGRLKSLSKKESDNEEQVSES